MSVNPKILKRNFYKKDTLDVAQALLGCFLIRKIGKKTIRAMITDVEAYVGEDDLACHASKGRTPRTEIMYGEAGHAYVYFVYGMHNIINFITEKKNFPAAVMLRGIEINQGDGHLVSFGRFGRETPSVLRVSGPGRLTKFMRIDRKLNGWNLTKGEKLWVEKGIKVPKNKIRKSKRVGIDYAKHCKHYLWRFYLA
ncbi:MAG TPA: 3-methyladenine DNA glycosylase [Candidatus Moranbacteria bacterium]|nr:3-methyladenine DNA glycosylase [Candidatus Moranbacteria bacterium]